MAVEELVSTAVLVGESKSQTATGKSVGSKIKRRTTYSRILSWNEGRNQRPLTAHLTSQIAASK
jgi:hypothetical protein